MIGARTPLCFDTETSLIRPALLAPPLCVVTWQEPGKSAQIIHHTDAEPLIRGWLEDDSKILVGHNIAYDLAVICERYPHLRPLVFFAYANDRVTDTMIREQLLDVAGGVYRGRPGEKGKWITHEYSLEDVSKRKAGFVLLKDGWRLSYSEFLDTPLRDWPTRAREVQAKARPRVVELDRRIAQAEALGDDEYAKALTKERDGLTEMIDGDPSRASEYPLDDARATLAVYLAQEKHVAYLADQYRQARAAWALHLSSAWGLRTDAVGVEILRAATQEAYDELETELIELGLIRKNKTRSRDTKKAKARMIAVCKEEGILLRRTDSHTDTETKKFCKDAAGNRLPTGHDDCVEHVSLDADACNATGDDVLEDYAEISTLKKVLSNDIEALRKGTEYPVHTRYGFAETGRTTSSKPNIQNLRRKAGIREAFIPRPGHCFVSADFPALELYTLAQCCVSWLGRSKLADALNRGLDPHLAMASKILKVTYEDAHARHDDGDAELDDMRQLSKLGNFGFPGGMGPKKLLRSIQKQLGQMNPDLLVRLTKQGFLTPERITWLKTQWFETWPEMPLYFARINALCENGDGKAVVETLFTKRSRGGASYCAAANNGFQGLGSDCAKEAAWRICCEQYNEPTSALYNTRTVFFVHDEFGIESPLDRIHESGIRLGDVMVEGANKYLPDVPISRAKVKPVAMLRWSKKAKPVFDVDGRLIPCAA